MKTKEKVILQPSLCDNNPISLLDDEKNILFDFLSISHFPISLLKLEYPANTDCILKHQHTRIEILIIDEGSLEVVTNSNRFIAQEGDIVVTDVRIKHEYNVFKQAGAISIRVEADRGVRESRGGKLVGEDDITEIDLDDIQDWDFVIDNNSDYETLKQKVLEIIEKLN